MYDLHQIVCVLEMDTHHKPCEHYLVSCSNCTHCALNIISELPCMNSRCREIYIKLSLRVCYLAEARVSHGCISVLQAAQGLTQDSVKPIEVQEHFLLMGPGDEGGVWEWHRHHRACSAGLPGTPGPQQPCMGCQVSALIKIAL